MINNRRNLMGMLVWLTALFIVAQFVFFLIHYKVSDLLDSLLNSSVLSAFLTFPFLAPFILFILLQLVAYALFVFFIWFITISLGQLFMLSANTNYWLGLFVWLMSCTALLGLNAYYFPNSFFAIPFLDVSQIVLLVPAFAMLCALLLAYFNFFFKKKHWLGMVFLILGLGYGGLNLHEKFFTKLIPLPLRSSRPDIILIGLDSLRPDFTSFFSNKDVHTPHIDALLKSATVFTNAYTPLGRTFPAWLSILTARYPIHHRGRINLIDPALLSVEQTLAKQLRANGYETFYGTDEPRFTDIDSSYGFDHIIGPQSGVAEFILGGLTDFPLTNLLVNFSFGRFLFPYQYANRAADITYRPNSFLHLVSHSLAYQYSKPVFLSLHLCMAHWPYDWAGKHFSNDVSVPDQYRQAVERLDSQLGDLIQILKQAGLLKHTVLILFSDHGNALGMLGDRVIDKDHYLGDPKKLKKIKLDKLSSAPHYSLDFQRDYSINTAYGSGTEVLSLKQHQVLLMMKTYGSRLKNQIPEGKQITQAASLIDISPTLLDILGLKQLRDADGISLVPYFFAKQAKTNARALFFETGDKLADLETDMILIEKIVKHTIQAFVVNKATGQITINPLAEKSIIKTKQRAILYGNWLLALYPPSMSYRLTTDKTQRKNLIIEPFSLERYFVLVNLKNKQWTLDLSSPLAKQAPLHQLLLKFKSFYGDEV